MDLHEQAVTDAMDCLTNLGGEPGSWIYPGATIRMLRVSRSAAGPGTAGEFLLVLNVQAPLLQVREYYREHMAQAYEVVDHEAWDRAEAWQSSSARVVVQLDDSEPPNELVDIIIGTPPK